MSAIFFTADDWDISVTLKTDGVATNVSGATDISAAVVTNDDDNPTQVVATTALASGATGADWTNGVVVAEFSSANTDITPGIYLVEIQVTENSKKKTWPRVPITVKKGTIS